MPFLLGDIFIGDFPMTQAFGANPAVYSAKFGLKGHNGVDFGAPSLTLIIAAADGFVFETGFDSAGYGNYIKIVHDGYLTLYGHLNDITVQKNDKIVSGQLIAHSNNTGFSSAPHLHFGVAPCDPLGNKTQEDNGYSGYIDPMSSLCEWKVLNLTAPVIPTVQTNPPITVDPTDLNIKSVQATDFQTIVNFGLQNGLGVYLTNNNDSIDLINNPADEKGGEKINKWISSLITEINALKNPTPDQVESQITNIENQATTDQKNNFIQNIFNGIRDFIFVKK